MAIYPIIVQFNTGRARSMHDVACEFARAVLRSKDAQKQLVPTSLSFPTLEKLSMTFTANGKRQKWNFCRGS